MPRTEPTLSAAPRARIPVARPDRTTQGIILMCLVSFIFGIQDGLSRMLAGAYSPILVVMIRYWFFTAFVILLVSRQPGGLRQALRTKRPLTQIARGIILVAEIVVTVEAFVRLGLVETHAIFTVYPLLVAALSGPVLGEKVGWRRWAAIGVGFIGILVILDPGARVFSPEAGLPLLGALLFAIYGLLTRHVARDDPAIVSFFWTAIAGVGAITVIGLPHWQPLAAADWPWMLALSFCGIGSHYLMIRAYEAAEASALQPFAYTQLVWVAIIGVTIFGETLRMNVVLGTLIVVGAGLFTLWRAQVRARAQAQAARAAAADPAP